MVSRFNALRGALRAHPERARWLSLGGVMALFLLVNLALMPHGVFAGGDSPRYVDGGQDLAAGQPLTVEKGVSYLGYIGLVAGSMAAGLSLYGVVIAQLAAALAAIAAIYDLGRSLGGHRAGMVAAGLLAADAWLGVQNFVVMTDALYSSLVVIATWAIYRAGERGGWNFLIALAAAVTAASVRPNGYLLIPIGLMYVIWRRIPDRRWRWAGIAVVLAALLAAAALPSWLHGEVAAENPGGGFQIGLTVWRWPQRLYWLVLMPPDPALDGGDWLTVARYGLAHPLATGWLMIVRVAIHFANVRPDASLLMNVTSSLWLAWVYPLAAIGFVQNRRGAAGALAGLCLAIIGAHTAVVALTWADQHGRFLFYVLPLLYLFAAAAVSRAQATSILWKAIRTAGVAVVIVRVASGASPEVYTSWLPGSSYLALGGPSPLAATVRHIQYGDEVDLLGFKPIGSPARAGSTVPLALVWQGRRALPTNYSESVWLADASGARIGGEDGRLGGGFFSGAAYGTMRWTAGLVMVDQPTLTIPANAPRVVRVYLSVYGRDKNLVVATWIDGRAAQEGQVLLQTIEVGR